MDNTQHIRVIRPNSRATVATFSALRALGKEVVKFRSHVKIVFRQQFQAAYAGSGLGVFWNYLLPVIPLTVYLFLSRLRLFPNFEGVDSATYLTFGVTMWFFLVGCVQTPIKTIRSRNKEVMKTAFPLSAAIVSEFAKLLFDTLVRIGFVALVILGTQSWPVWSSLLFPLVLLPGFLMFLGAGMLLGILNVIYDDVGKVVSIILQYGIFVSGVIFPIPDGGLFATFNRFNPFAVFIEAARGMAYQGQISNPVEFGIFSALAIAIFLLACRVFYVMEYKIRGLS